jgi:hypothetical protein
VVYWIESVRNQSWSIGYDVSGKVHGFKYSILGINDGLFDMICQESIVVYFIRCVRTK